ncbi:bifunctional diaminohydroxyphosphoribosylaminopyrimidine deaminase/5-amino-6-(5-phosphoribosylamino)uracil reductase RibD [Pseudahrensia aquimaris]|uniref:Riboflavin biosynthesis protein RibD n=1 Tax=Pseudahrensia aquimaris TaxID=744461 RepID=A0ABW3FBP4_9HYPH
MNEKFSHEDHRFMAACLRHARRNRGLTGTNPSVGTLIVREGRVVGRGITAQGGRPHAETLALRQAGEAARGATAYVSLEPCAHHGVTPPCAQALIDAGVSRVITAWIDPDARVDGQGHAMLIEAGIKVETGLLAQMAARDLRGYLNRKTKNRPQVILKLAVSRDGMIGRQGEEVSITGPLARAYGHRMRAEVDGILVGRGTVQADDPDLTCRLSGLEQRSPHRFILDTNATLSTESRLVNSALRVPVSLITTKSALPSSLASVGVRHFIAEAHDGTLALPEILEDMAASGLSSLLVEGGAQVACSFLEANLVDEIALFRAPVEIGQGGIASPITSDSVPDTFALARTLQLGDDTLELYSQAS